MRKSTGDSDRGIINALEFSCAYHIWFYMDPEKYPGIIARNINSKTQLKQTVSRTNEICFQYNYLRAPIGLRFTRWYVN